MTPKPFEAVDVCEGCIRTKFTINEYILRIMRQCSLEYCLLIKSSTIASRIVDSSIHTYIYKIDAKNNSNINFSYKYIKIILYTSIL